MELHGRLAYLIDRAVRGGEYTIIGYKCKQVRDQIHCDDVARLFVQFFKAPRCGEVFNLGGGRQYSISILETIDAQGEAGLSVRARYDPKNRLGDHICYITDLSKLRSHFPNWKIDHTLSAIISEIVSEQRKSIGGPAAIVPGAAGERVGWAKPLMTPSPYHMPLCGSERRGDTTGGRTRGRGARHSSGNGQWTEGVVRLSVGSGGRSHSC